MEGKLAEHPLAELIREIGHAGLSGALRLTQQPAKVVIYFEAGKPVFAASNLRAHRLRQALRRSGMTGAQLALTSPAASDDKLAAALLASGALTQDSLQKVRGWLVRDVLRAALLWPDGLWAFDQRVRVAADLRVDLNIDQLLLESARHLPFALVKSRFDDMKGVYSVTNGGHLALLPAEELVLSRATVAENPVHLSDLVGRGLPEEEILRSVYGLSLAGHLQRTDWALALTGALKEKPKPEAAQLSSADAGRKQSAGDEHDAEELLKRLQQAKNHYEVLDVTPSAALVEIKDSYHKLARRFHPDRFHQSASALRRRIESAFARIAQAYEILSDASRRADYDRSFAAAPARPAVATQTSDRVPVAVQAKESAETNFRQGVEALKRNQHDEAIRLLAKAATLEPRAARYRAHYGSALMHRPNSRRTAENELRAALALEPDNASFRVMLAELYKTIGLRRRAQNEAARALVIDPKNEAARALLAGLNDK